MEFHFPLTPPLAPTSTTTNGCSLSNSFTNGSFSNLERTISENYESDLAESLTDSPPGECPRLANARITAEPEQAGVGKHPTHAAEQLPKHSFRGEQVHRHKDDRAACRNAKRTAPWIEDTN